ncbi:hypothetical protein LSH36_484g04131 [Paralvinella palmiformis]|uniref:5'-AMP-activated protein kinase subunit beta-1 n=1 Tax=Paralvinella palmiformis TaxID=53620 RepID=A0AAD9J9K4_9ANNE|nr:hypothetical protein LSH36_484g04131 [Paralvinella palmiformis]
MPEESDAPLEQLAESVRSGEQPESEITETSKETDNRPLPEQTESESEVRDVIEEHETKSLESTDSKEFEEVAEPEGVIGDESEVVVESKEPTVDRSEEFLHVTEMKSDVIIPSDVHLSEDETDRSEIVIGHEIALSEETSHDESEKVPEEEVKEEEIGVICKESDETAEEADIVAEAVTSVEMSPSMNDTEVEKELTESDKDIGAKAEIYSGWKEVDVFEHERNSLLLTSTISKDSEEVVGLHHASKEKLEKCKEGEIICELGEASYKTEQELKGTIKEVKPFKESTVHRSTEIRDIMVSSACINQSEEFFSRTGEACDSEPNGEKNGDRSKPFDVNEEMLQNRTVDSVASSTSSICSSDSDSAASFTFENPSDIVQTLHPANQSNQHVWDTHETHSTSSVSTELDRRSERPCELSVMSPECDITEQVIVQSPRSTTMVTVSPDSITIECMFNSKKSDSTLSSMNREDQLPLGMSREQTSFHRLFSDRNREGCVQSNDESSAGASTKWDHSVHTYKLHTSDSDRVSLPLKSDTEEVVSISMQGYVATERQEAFIKRTKIIATISIQPVNSKGINLLLAKYEHTVPTTGEIIAFEQSLNKNFSDCHETKTTVISSEEEYHATFSNEQCTLSMIGQDSGLGLSQVMGSSWETDLSAGAMTPKETAAISEGAFQTAFCTDEVGVNDYKPLLCYAGFLTYFNYPNFLCFVLEFQQEMHSAESSSSVTHEFLWEHGGQDVYLCGSFNNWMPIPDSVFKIALQVPEGKHYYRYIVDEETTVNLNQVIEGDLNCVELKRID